MPSPLLPSAATAWRAARGSAVARAWRTRCWLGQPLPSFLPSAACPWAPWPAVWGASAAWPWPSVCGRPPPWPWASGECVYDEKGGRAVQCSELSQTSCALCSHAYWQLLLARLLTAISQAACVPFATSIIADVFPTARRGESNLHDTDTIFYSSDADSAMYVYDFPHRSRTQHFLLRRLSW